MEAAGQRSISFETGWTMPSSVLGSEESERSVLSGSPKAIPILVPAHSTAVGRSMSLYRARKVGPSTPLGVATSLVAERSQGSPIEPRYHFALAGKGDHCVNRTRVRKPSAISSTCVVTSIVLTGSNPTNRAR